jgi:hypothetical protein
VENSLIVNAVEEIHLSGHIVQLPKCITTFARWKGSPIQDNYGGKIVLTLDGEPLFAELVVLRLLEKQHWYGVWVDSYRRKYRTGLPEAAASVTLDGDREGFLQRIRDCARASSGCFDVFAWRGEEYRFVELKRARKDRIRETQKRWLAAALRCGLKVSDLLIVEWDVASEH